MTMSEGLPDLVSVPATNRFLSTPSGFVLLVVRKLSADMLPCAQDGDDASFFCFCFYLDDGSFYTVTMAVFFFIVTMAVFVLRRCQFLYCDDGSFCTVTMAVSVL